MSINSRQLCFRSTSRQLVVSGSVSRRTALSTVGLSGVQLLSPLGISASTATDDAAGDDAGPGPGSEAASLDHHASTTAGRQEGGSRRAVAKLLPRIPKAKLCCGLEVSQIIKGCWQLDGAHTGDPRSDHTSGPAALADFDKFIMAGATTWDTADIYGSAEATIGQYFRLSPWQRDNVQLLTKVTIGEGEASNLSRTMLEYRVRASMKRMGVTHIDMVQLHWEDFNARGYVDAAMWLTDMRDAGLMRHVGVTNFDAPHLIKLLDAGVPVASNQVQYSVLDRRPELFLTQLCEKHRVSLLPYGVLAGGFLSNAYLGKPAGQAKLDTLSKAKAGALLREMGGWAFAQEVLQVLQRVAKKHSASISAVAIRWVLAQQQVPAAIIGARNAYHVRDLRSAFSFALDEEDMLDLDAAYEGAERQPQHDVFIWERGGPW